MNELLNYCDIKILKKTNDINKACRFDIASQYIHDFDFVYKTLDLYDWDFEYLSMNTNITVEFVEKALQNNKGKFVTGMYGLSSNKALFDLIQKNKDSPLWFWGFGGVSVNQGLTLDFVEDNLDKEWHWGSCGLSNNPFVTPEFVLKYSEKEWVFDKKLGLTFQDPR